MRYTVVVKYSILSNGVFHRIRYNNIPKRIFKILLKYRFSFMVGIANNTVNSKNAEKYIEVFAKSGQLRTVDWSNVNTENEYMNDYLLTKLEKWSHKK